MCKGLKSLAAKVLRVNNNQLALCVIYSEIPFCNRKSEVSIAPYNDSSILYLMQASRKKELCITHSTDAPHRHVVLFYRVFADKCSLFSFQLCSSCYRSLNFNTFSAPWCQKQNSPHPLRCIFICLVLGCSSVLGSDSIIRSSVLWQAAHFEVT